MAKQLNAEQKTIGELLSKRGAKFLVPDYQRTYSWKREECETLWDDIVAFAFPFDRDFDSDNDKYFLGTILTFQNESRESEIIDGQQRLITFLLMLRAFYTESEKIQFDNKDSVLSSIGQCIWRTDEFGNVEKTSVKLKSEVASDEDLTEFKKILATGNATKGNASNYAKNYRDFQNWIKNFKEKRPGDFSYLPMRILNNCILLPIDVDSQNTALGIFTTLNDRGTPLTDSDIFRAQFYKLFSRDGRQSKDLFNDRWKSLVDLCKKNFHPRKGTFIDDLFRRYMYYAKTKRAIERNERISDTFSDMRDFYAEDNYKLLRDEKTFAEIELLAKFWDDVTERSDRFSLTVLKKLYVLSFSPYSLWSYVVSLYFMSNRELDEKKFCTFLDRTTAMILMNAVLDLGKQNIRRPFVLEFKKIFRGEPLEFDKQFKRSEKIVRNRLAETRFTNNKNVTRAMSAWWTFSDENQKLPPPDTKLHLEHIYATKRHEINPEELSNPDMLETLGNKSLLEDRINISASDNRFADKKKFYNGFTDAKGKFHDATFNLELCFLAENLDDFTEADIRERNEEIFTSFIEYLRGNKLLV